MCAFTLNSSDVNSIVELDGSTLLVILSGRKSSLGFRWTSEIPADTSSGVTTANFMEAGGQKGRVIWAENEPTERSSLILNSGGEEMTLSVDVETNFGVCSLPNP